MAACSYDTRDNNGDMFNDITALSPTIKKIVADIYVPKPGGPPIPNAVSGVAVDPRTSTVRAPENGVLRLTLISACRDEVARNLSTGSEPVAVAVDPITKNAWVSATPR